MIEYIGLIMGDLEIYQYLIQAGVVVVFAVYNTILIKYFMDYMKGERAHRAKMMKDALTTIDRLSEGIEEVLEVVKEK